MTLSDVLLTPLKRCALPGRGPQDCKQARQRYGCCSLQQAGANLVVWFRRGVQLWGGSRPCRTLCCHTVLTEQTSKGYREGG